MQWHGKRLIYHAIKHRNGRQEEKGCKLWGNDNGHVTDGFLFLCLILRWCGRGGGGSKGGGIGERRGKQFHQCSSKLSDRGNFDPLALLCSPPTIFPSFTFLSLRSLRGRYEDIPSGQNQHLFSIKCYGAAHLSNTHPDHMLLFCVNTH